MPYYDECPLCGATLDPCEKCDCEGIKKSAPEEDRTSGAATRDKKNLSSNKSIAQKQEACQEWNL